jgi:hypothetical protein
LTNIHSTLSMHRCLRGAAIFGRLSGFDPCI